jgi:Tfp pilus assembly protein PilF
MWKFLVGFMAFAGACISGVDAWDSGVTAKSKAVAHYVMAVSYDLNGRGIEAIYEYERSIAFDRTQPLPHIRLASYYLRAGLLERSVRELNQVLRLDPTNSQAHYLLALVYSAQKKYDLAAQEYEIILKTAANNDPENVEIYTYLAQLYFSQTKYPQAIEQFQHILAVDPNNSSANYFLATSYLEMHQRDKAKEFFQKTLALDADNDGALNSIAYMNAEEGTNLDHALALARRAVALDPSNGAYYDTLGWVFFKKGMNTQALMALQKAERYIQDPIVYEHMGDVYNAIGQFALARSAWDKSLHLDPHQPQVQAKIEALDNKARAFQHQS